MGLGKVLTYCSGREKQVTFFYSNCHIFLNFGLIASNGVSALAYIKYCPSWCLLHQCRVTSFSKEFFFHSESPDLPSAPMWGYILQNIKEQTNRNIYMLKTTISLVQITSISLLHICPRSQSNAHYL